MLLDMGKPQYASATEFQRTFVPFPGPARALAPIIIGVTGHRNPHPDGAADLRAELDKTLRRFDRHYPNSPKMLATGLAQGADLLAAQCALDLGWQVIAVLALPVDEFLATFDGEEKEASIE